MTEERVKRKLSGILSADAVGYSRLMEEDEASTIRTLEDSKMLMSRLIQQYHGRVVDAPGDNLLAEFRSVVDATECSVTIQRKLKTKNAEQPDDQRMAFRIGVNLGDVVEEADRIYGDGVNIAARIEGLAHPGGVCISRGAYDHVKKKLELGYEYLGEHSVKNISEPVRVYRVLMEPEAAGKVIGEKKFIGRVSRRTAMTIIVGLIIVAGGLIGWNLYLQQSKKVEPASLDKMAYPLPNKPSIAVLPFNNLSGNSKQDYIADGITENIISALSQNSEMFIISGNSMFTYKGSKVKIGKVSEDLGVRYVLKGNVQKSEERIRVNAQLVDAIKGYHLWSERYERNIKDFFAVQDEITQKVAIALQIELTHGERTRSYMSTQNLGAWEHAVKGNRYFIRYTKKDNSRARELFEQATVIDPNYAFAWSLLAWTHIIDAWFKFTKSQSESLNKAIGFTQKALSLDDSIPNIHSSLSFIHLMRKNHEEAITEGRKALSLSPNDATSHMLLALTLCYAGKFEMALPMAKIAMRLSPHIPSWYFAILGLTYYMTERYEESLSAYKQLLEQSQLGEIAPIWAHIGLISVFMQLERKEEAHAHTTELLRLDPNFSLNWVKTIMPFKESSHLTNILSALRQAGLN
jgi:adenylate cyclase